MDDTPIDEPSMVDTVSVDATLIILLDSVDAVIVDARRDEPVSVEY
jgi:hypothetical protein